jgi:N-acyl-phosphatidylethanolamine-hydrolysing phospholipase D
VSRLLLLALLAAAFPGCAGTGEPRPGGPYHHLQRGFRNLNPDYARPEAWTRWGFLVRRVLGGIFAPRHIEVDRVENDGQRLRDNQGEPTVTWIGHATVLVQLDGVNVLTDPHWSPRASPVSFAGPTRLSAPGLRFEDLPRIDAVVVSHDHYDHLDVATVTRLAATHRPRFLVPLGLKAWFAELGIDVEELDWWETRTVGGLVITAVPVQHWSARTWRDTDRRLWTGWAVAGREKRFFFAGDTGYWPPLFQEIGRRLGPFDLAAVSIGAYLPPAIMRLSHTTPEEALALVADVGARQVLGIHWGTFDLADEPLGEPPERFRSAAARQCLGPDRAFVLRLGETRPW